MLNAQKGVNTSLSFPLVTDSFHLINYHYDSTSIEGSENIASFIVTYNGQNAMVFFSGDMFDVNIASYKNSRLSGTFSAKLTPYGSSIDYNDRGTLVITEGLINNIPVSY